MASGESILLSAHPEVPSISAEIYLILSLVYIRESFKSYLLA